MRWRLLRPFAQAMLAGTLLLPTSVRATEYTVAAPLAIPGWYAGDVSAAVLGDMDGDRRPDVILAAAGGRVYLLSGADGSPVIGWEAPDWPTGRFGAAAAGVGDVDGDRRPDLAVGAPGVNSLFLFTSSRHYGLARLVLLPPGCPGCEESMSLAGVGDPDGDGRADFLIGLPGARDNDGRLLLVFGDPRKPAVSFDGKAREGLGFALAPAGDYDGDGRPEVLVGAPGRNRAALLSLPDGTRPLELRAPGGETAGRSLAVPGDVNGDGSPDFAVGDPLWDGGKGRITIFSGQDGSPLYTVEGAEPGGELGCSLAAAGDANGDGVPDLLAGAPYGRPGKKPGRVYLLSGRDGTVLQQLQGRAPGDRFGWQLAVADDVNGDSVADFLVVARGQGGSQPPGGAARVQGAVYLLLSQPHPSRAGAGSSAK